MRCLLYPQWSSLLLANIDEPTRQGWAEFTDGVEREMEQHGAAVVQTHMEKALRHLMAAAWALRHCYSAPLAMVLLERLGDIAEPIERFVAALPSLAPKNESHH